MNTAVSPLHPTEPGASASCATAATQPWQSLHCDPHGHLVLRLADGSEQVGITPVRAFPLANPTQGVALVGQDGQELAWITDLASLPETERQLLEQTLAVREFVPEIQRIVGVSSFSTPSTWQIQTNRGTTQLVLKGEEDIRRLSQHGQQGKLLIASRDGLYFSIPDVARLDAHSRRILERFL